MKFKSWVISGALVMLSLFSATSAQAADGCKFLLCIAGNWRNIGECRPTVYEVFRDLARGRAFPSCAMSGAGNSAGNSWANQTTCPVMYREYDPETGSYAGCRYPGRIAVNINGALWSQVFWDMAGNTSTWFSDSARTSLAQPGASPMDDTFLNDVTRWNAQGRQCTSAGGTPSYGEFGAFLSCAMPDYGGGGN